MTGTIPSQGTLDLLLSEPSLLSLPLLPFCLHAQDLLIEMQIAEAHSLDYLALASKLVAGACSSKGAMPLIITLSLHFYMLLPTSRALCCTCRIC